MSLSGTSLIETLESMATEADTPSFREANIETRVRILAGYLAELSGLPPSLKEECIERTKTNESTSADSTYRK